MKQKFFVNVLPDPRKTNSLAERGGFDLAGQPDLEDVIDADDAVIVEAAPGQPDELEGEEKEEAEMALIVISTLFTLLLCA